MPREALTQPMRHAAADPRLLVVAAVAGLHPLARRPCGTSSSYRGFSSTTSYAPTCGVAFTLPGVEEPHLVDVPAVEQLIEPQEPLGVARVGDAVVRGELVGEVLPVLHVEAGACASGSLTGILRLLPVVAVGVAQVDELEHLVLRGTPGPSGRA